RRAGPARTAALRAAGRLAPAAPPTLDVERRDLDGHDLPLLRPLGAACCRCGARSVHTALPEPGVPAPAYPHRGWRVNVSPFFPTSRETAAQFPRFPVSVPLLPRSVPQLPLGGPASPPRRYRVLTATVPLLSP